MILQYLYQVSCGYYFWLLDKKIISEQVFFFKSVSFSTEVVQHQAAAEPVKMETGPGKKHYTVVTMKHLPYATD